MAPNFWNTISKAEESVAVIAELFRVYRCFGFALPDSASTCALKVNSSSCPARVSEGQPEISDDKGIMKHLCLKFCLDLVQHVGLHEKMRLIHCELLS